MLHVVISNNVTKSKWKKKLCIVGNTIIIFMIIINFEIK